MLNLCYETNFPKNPNQSSQLTAYVLTMHDSALVISSLCVKLSQACGLVCKIRHFADMKILCLMYFSLFHSYLQYCIIGGDERIKLLSGQCKCYKTEF